MKKLIGAILGLAAAIIIMGGISEFVWKQFQIPQDVGSNVISPSDDLKDVTKEWFLLYTKKLSGWTVPYEYRIRKAKIENIEVLDENGYVQLDYEIWVCSRNPSIIQNLELISTNSLYRYEGQTVLKWEKETDWVLKEKMRPVQYQLQSPEMQEEREKPQTDHYLPETGKKETYWIDKNTVYVTYDSGEHFRQVPDGYERICKEANGTYNEYLPENSYIITSKFTAFIGYEENRTILIYSTDEGKTWKESVIRKGGYKANSFLSKTETMCYATFAVDRALGNDAYVTMYTKDFQKWTEVKPEGDYWTNLSCVFWSHDKTGYYSRRSDARTLYMTSDQGESYTQVILPAAQDVVNELGFDPFDTIEKIEQQDGKLLIVAGQGDDGDYVNPENGNLFQLLYESADGIHFTYVKKISDAPELAG